MSSPLRGSQRRDGTPHHDSSTGPRPAGPDRVLTRDRRGLDLAHPGSIPEGERPRAPFRPGDEPSGRRACSLPPLPTDDSGESRIGNRRRVRDVAVASHTAAPADRADDPTDRRGLHEHRRADHPPPAGGLARGRPGAFDARGVDPRLPHARSGDLAIPSLAIVRALTRRLRRSGVPLA